MKNYITVGAFQRQNPDLGSVGTMKRWLTLPAREHFPVPTPIKLGRRTYYHRDELQAFFGHEAATLPKTCA